jgi:hypothetical protein
MNRVLNICLHEKREKEHWTRSSASYQVVLMYITFLTAGWQMCVCSGVRYLPFSLSVWIIQVKLYALLKKICLCACVCTLYWFECALQHNIMITKRDNDDKQQFFFLSFLSSIEFQDFMICKFSFSKEIIIIIIFSLLFQY